MKKRIKMLALAFSTEDFLELEEWANKNWRNVDFKILEWQCMGALHQEVARSAVRNSDAEGIMIVERPDLTDRELGFVVRYLADLDKRLYTTSGGMKPLEMQEILETCDLEDDHAMESHTYDGHRDRCSI